MPNARCPVCLQACRGACLTARARARSPEAVRAAEAIEHHRLTAECQALQAHVIATNVNARNGARLRGFKRRPGGGIAA